MIGIRDVQYHRNGICGMPFSVVSFTWEGRNMIAIRFDGASQVNPRIAVLDADMVGEGNIRFGENSWRGDNFVFEVDQAIEEALL